MKCTICNKEVEKPIQMRGHMSGHARVGKKRPGAGPKKNHNNNFKISKRNIDDHRYYTGDGYVMMRNQHGHPLANLSGQVPEHRKVLYDKIGSGEHKCWWCGINLIWDKKSTNIINVDHLDGVIDNNSPSNLVSACHKCNRIGARLVQHKKEYE